MTPDSPDAESCYERFTVAYPSGTVIPAFYFGGATLIEVQITHPWRWSRRSRIHW